MAALGLPLYAVVPTYYTEVLGLPPGGVGIVLLLVRIFDAVADPLVGLVADRFRPDFAGSGNQPTALWTLAVAYAWIPIGLKLIAVALMGNFPLDEAAHKILRAEIDGR